MVWCVTLLQPLSSQQWKKSIIDGGQNTQVGFIVTAHSDPDLFIVLSQVDKGNNEGPCSSVFLWKISMVFHSSADISVQYSIER